MLGTLTSPEQFAIIGENLHTTRVVKRNGVRATTLDDGVEAVKYRSEGEWKYVRVPEHFTKTQAYQQGNLKHFMIAVWKGVHGDPREQAEGLAYIHWEALRQVNAGAAYLDLNVDEASYRLEEQKTSMRWLVEATQQVSTVPLSIDSSNTEIIEAGLSTYDGKAGRPMLNSVALERLDALDMVEKFSSTVMITAASESGMPSNAQERLDNVARVIEATLSKGVPEEDIFIDPLYFPISVAAEYGPHALDAIRMLRKEYGGRVHISGGMSNVSFGLPRRKLVNDVFLRLAIEAGADSGIIDPVQSDIREVFELDMDAEPVQITRKMLEGEDEYCINFLSAYRAGRLD